MNRDQIIAKTLDDMHRYETDFENREPGSADRDAEYNRDILMPEMLRRLPDGDITTCEEAPTRNRMLPNLPRFIPAL